MKEEEIMNLNFFYWNFNKTNKLMFIEKNKKKYKNKFKFKNYRFSCYSSL